MTASLLLCSTALRCWLGFPCSLEEDLYDLRTLIRPLNGISSPSAFGNNNQATTAALSECDNIKLTLISCSTCSNYISSRFINFKHTDCLTLFSSFYFWATFAAEWFFFSSVHYQHFNLKKKNGNRSDSVWFVNLSWMCLCTSLICSCATRPHFTASLFTFLLQCSYKLSLIASQTMTWTRHKSLVWVM